MLPATFTSAVEQLIPRDRRFDDPLSTLAFGTDASFYRMIPKLVLRVESELEVVALLKLADAERVPVTFRAAGTSLSGQAISDSVLIVLGDHWNRREIRNNGQQIRLQPGVIGAQANAALAPFKRKIGPDPASIGAAKIGGIVANNSSGMCCGTAQNTYQTLAGLRLVLADGMVVDSESPSSVANFRASHGELLEQLAELGRQTRANIPLASKIRHKYRLKNTTGFSINALIDFEDPLDILNHLMVGSEGTLGFISAVTYDTVPDHPHKASALIVFPDVGTCCNAVPVLKQQPVAAVELLDRRSLRSVENMAGMPAWVRELSAGACALLIESRAASAALLQEQLAQVMASIVHFPVEKQVDFSDDPVVYNQLWRIRKDTFPAVGAVRQTGTTVIIEDVTFPVEKLAGGVNRLLELFDKHGYDEAIIFGHALEGNLHFVFTQGFDDPLQVARYEAFMGDVTQLVAVEYGGALKAEHGTGRNMAPFVELEWGTEAYQVMWKIKRLLDPRGILNPDVVLSEDRQIHLKNFKPMPAADDIVDKCIECGFCEPVCPSNGLTLTPRQRIVIWRDIQERKRAGIDTRELEHAYQRHGLDTCAATGLCAQRCPVGINTGDLIRKLRGTQADSPRAANWLAEHFASAVQGARFTLFVANTAHRMLGTQWFTKTTAGLTRVSQGKLPQWTPAMPQPVQRLQLPRPAAQDERPRVVYLAACVSRVMGPAAKDQEQQSLFDKTCGLLEKAGYQVIFPDNLNTLCCGQPFMSKGYAEQAEHKRQETLDALLKASRGGLDPIYCDTSPCTLRLMQDLADERLDIHDPVRFIRTHLLDRLEFEPQDSPIAVHVTCSTQHLGEAQALIDIARRCAKQVVIPEGIHCCGFAGDKGFTTPELNSHALRSLKTAVQICDEGISTSRTCEIGLSQHSGIDYHGLVYLVDRVSRRKPVFRPASSSSACDGMALNQLKNE